MQSQGPEGQEHGWWPCGQAPPYHSPLAVVEVTAVARAAPHLQLALAIQGVTGDLEQRDLIRCRPFLTPEGTWLPSWEPGSPSSWALSPHLPPSTHPRGSGLRAGRVPLLDTQRMRLGQDSHHLVDKERVRVPGTEHVGRDAPGGDSSRRGQGAAPGGDRGLVQLQEGTGGSSRRGRGMAPGEGGTPSARTPPAYT